MIKQTIATIGLTLLTFSAFAGNARDLSVDSSWEEIMATRNIDVTGAGIKVGNTNTTVFFVEEADGKLYTKKPTKDGFYKTVRQGKDNDRKEWVEQGESIKSGDVTIQVAQYERKRVNRDRDQQIFTGYKDYTQPLTRELSVYEVKRNSNDNEKRRLLFKKEYTVNSKS